MKLKNKKTGEIREVEARDDGIYLYDRTLKQWYKYDFHLLAKWWEVYEELKEYWYIDTAMMEVTYNTLGAKSDLEEFNKQIDNYFSSEEEAEKAVEKLKAWKRLKDKGFEFCCDIKKESLCGNGFNIPLNAIMPPEAYTDTEVVKDLDLLFGGEE